MVYLIWCSRCVLNTYYIVEARQYPKINLSTYVHIYNLNSNQSALCYHSVNTDHVFNFDNTIMLCREDDMFRRLFLESIFSNTLDVPKYVEFQH